MSVNLAEGRAGAERGPLVGRRTELDLLVGAVSTARGGEAQVMLVSGAAGIGKTTLVEAATSAARAGGAVVLTGHAVQLNEAAFPYAAVTEAVRGLRRSLGDDALTALLGGGHDVLERLVPELGVTGAGTAPSWGQGQLFEAVLHLLGALAAERPVVLVAEDLHWADQATLDLLNFLARNLAAAPVVVVGTARQELPPRHPLRAWTAELVRLPHVRAVTLAPLDRSGIRELLRSRHGAPVPAPLVDEIHRRSDGNPFYAVELFGAAGDIDAAGRGRALPATLHATARARVDTLDPATVGMLEVMAVAGPRVAHDVLAEVAGDDEPALLAAIRQAVDHHVVVVEDAGYRFRHAAFAEALEADLLPPQRRRLHRAYAEVFDRRPDGTDPARATERAAHWLAAGEPQPALAATVVAARQAERQYALADAHRLWEQAVSLAARLGPDATAAVVNPSDLAADAAEAANRAGALDRAVDLATQAVTAVDAGCDARQASRLLERRGWYLTRRGDTDGARRDYEEALALAPVGEPSAERARALAAHARLQTATGELDAARRSAAAAIAAAVEAGDEAEEGYARHTLAIVLGRLGDVDGAFPELLRAAGVAEQTGDLSELSWVFIHFAAVASDAGRLAEAVPVIAERAGRARARGLDRLYGGFLDCVCAGARFDLGQWDECDRLVAAVAARTPTDLERIALHLVRGRLRVGRGDLAGAEDDLAVAGGLTAGLVNPRVDGMLYEARLDLARFGRRDDSPPDDARRLAADAVAAVSGRDDPVTVARVVLAALRVEADLADAARRAGWPDGATAAERHAESLLGVLDVAADAAGEAAGAALPVVVDAARAEGERVRGRTGARRWDGVIAGFEHLGERYPAAQARVRRAEALVGDGHRTEARADLDEVTAWALTAGARPLLDRAAGVLGRRPGEAAPASSPDAGGGPPDAHLTARELDVLRLLAQGLTNRGVAADLGMAEKTASVHVSRILAKLHARTRGEAAAIARRTGLA
jgi:DNA-binding CsgD family transcriptional regulator/tetratricopeptide (TPR) repeat protein